MASTFTDLGQTLEDFADTIYVRCPACQQCAHVRRIPADEEKIMADIARYGGSLSYNRSFSPRKLSCLHCGYTKTWQGHGRGGGGPRDWYFGLPLWLRTPCCGNILWAFNEEHLSFLEGYIAATHRPKFNINGERRNGTMISRLPLWMKTANHRDEVLKGIARLKEILEKV